MRDGQPPESNRYDGAPAPELSQTDMGAAPPSRAEAEESHRRHLRSSGCKNCGESDPDKLQQTPYLHPSCSARQKHPDPFIVLCDDCLDSRPDSYREKRVEQAKTMNAADDDRHVDAVVVYGCGRATFEEYEKPTRKGPDGEEIPVPHARPNAEVHLRCRCGETVEDIVHLGGGE